MDQRTGDLDSCCAEGFGSLKVSNKVSDCTEKTKTRCQEGRKDEGMSYYQIKLICYFDTAFKSETY